MGTATWGVAFQNRWGLKSGQDVDLDSLGEGRGHHRQGGSLSKGLGGGGEAEHRIGKERSGRRTEGSVISRLLPHVHQPAPSMAVVTQCV